MERIKNIGSNINLNRREVMLICLFAWNLVVTLAMSSKIINLRHTFKLTSPNSIAVLVIDAVTDLLFVVSILMPAKIRRVDVKRIAAISAVVLQMAIVISTLSVNIPRIKANQIVYTYTASVVMDMLEIVYVSVLFFITWIVASILIFSK